MLPYVGLAIVIGTTLYIARQIWGNSSHLPEGREGERQARLEASDDWSPTEISLWSRKAMLVLCLLMTAFAMMC